MPESAEVIEEALDIPIPSSPHLVLDDTRRLTGPGMLWGRPGAVMDVVYDDMDPEKIIRLWRATARRVLAAIGWDDEETIERSFDGGLSLALSAPMDQLYSAIFAAQTVWHFCAGQLLDVETGDFDEMIADLKAVMIREANPRLLALMDEAQARGLAALPDDEFLSVGLGLGSVTWSVFELPKPDDVDWENLFDIPVALITGTNGKTTSTRLSSAIARAAGKVAGLTSTDFVSVGNDVLDRGDYSGPGGARLLLRDKRVEVAFLEVARGGLLRRGLAVRNARAALVTNVAADHLGQYGINTVGELAVVKLAVHRALVDGGMLVLNADDPFVVAQAEVTPGPKLWFSLSPNTAQILASRKDGVACAWLAADTLMFFDGESEITVADVTEIPITMGGAARYNVSNALGALSLSFALGIKIEAIREGLRNFESDPKDNPGRCNEFGVNGARVFVDFAHNPHSIQAVVATMKAIPAKQRFILLGHAGDRSDQDIRDVTASALAMTPDIVVATELPEFLRGRELGDVSALIIQECIANSFDENRILNAASPLDGARQILDLVQPGDLALLLVLSERDQVFELINARA